MWNMYVRNKKPQKAKPETMLKCKICGIGIGTIDYKDIKYVHDEQRSFRIKYRGKKYTICEDCNMRHKANKLYRKWIDGQAKTTNA